MFYGVVTLPDIETDTDQRCVTPWLSQIIPNTIKFIKLNNTKYY